jgi:hypothetical protein
LAAAIAAAVATAAVQAVMVAAIRMCLMEPRLDGCGRSKCRRRARRIRIVRVRSLGGGCGVRSAWPVARRR